MCTFEVVLRLVVFEGVRNGFVNLICERSVIVRPTLDWVSLPRRLRLLPRAPSRPRSSKPRAHPRWHPRTSTLLSSSPMRSPRSARTAPPLVAPCASRVRHGRVGVVSDPLARLRCGIVCRAARVSQCFVWMRHVQGTWYAVRRQGPVDTSAIVVLVCSLYKSAGETICPAWPSTIGELRALLGDLAHIWCGP